MGLKVYNMHARHHRRKSYKDSAMFLNHTQQIKQGLLGQKLGQSMTANSSDDDYQVFNFDELKQSNDKRHHQEVIVSWLGTLQIMFLVLVIGVGVGWFNLMYNPSAGIHTTYFAKRVTVLSRKTTSQVRNTGEIQGIYKGIKSGMTDRQVLRVAGYPNDVSNYSHWSKIGMWVYTTDHNGRQVYVRFKSGRVFSKIYNTDNYTAEVRQHGNGQLVVQNGVRLKTESGVKLP